jgi:hypothetical protein
MGNLNKDFQIKCPVEHAAGRRGTNGWYRKWCSEREDSGGVVWCGVVCAVGPEMRTGTQTAARRQLG